LTAEPWAVPDVHIPAHGIDIPFRHAVIEHAAVPAPAEAVSDETRLWWARCDASVNIDAIVHRAAAGPLLANDLYSAVEVWTDAELSALHVLWILARQRGRHDWSARVDIARNWHLEHTQPDNATNRPWALHVFLTDDRFECQHYAETLLHNAMATMGHPDPFSAWILLDCAYALGPLVR
jgi:hypothetical protein